MANTPEQAGPDEPGLSLSRHGPAPERVPGATSPAISSVSARVGEVVILPPETEGHDKRNRRHAVVAEITPDRCGTAVYGSTSDRALKLGATAVKIWPRFIPSRNGFLHRTYLYPGRLSCVFAESLERRTGTLSSKEMVSLRRGVQRATGIGTGSCRAPGVTPGSWRGRVVRLVGELPDEGGVAVGVILTEHVYSSRRHFQIVAPLAMSDPEYDDDLDIALADTRLPRLFGEAGGGVVCTVPLVFSIFHPKEVSADTGIVLSEDHLASVESAVAGRLGCSSSAS